MMRLNLFCAVLLTLAAGCKPEPATPVVGNPPEKVYAVRGVIREISPDRHTATIQHEKIPGFMAAMTMDFTVKATNELKTLAPNDEISFKLVVREEDSWIEDIRFISHRIEEVTDGVVIIHQPKAELKPGDRLPDYEFTDETGGKIRLSDFHGRALAFTFFFTRCPLPEFCPRMSKDFADTRQLLTADASAPTNWQFLSISFDPEVDQPAVLSSYANYFREGNADRWLFAAASTNTLADLAPKLDLMVKHEGESISHNLRTVVLDPEGRITHQFDGNQWSAKELAAAMLEAARQSTNSTP